MAVVRRHWAYLLAIPCLVVAVLLAVFQPSTGSHAARASDVGGNSSTATQPSVADMAAAQAAVTSYVRVQQLRRELALTTQDLASLGVTGSTAGQIVSDVVAFLSGSTDPLADVNTACATADRALNEAVRQINTGEGGPSALTSLPTLKQNRDSATAARLSAMSPLIAAVNALLTPDQQAMWQSARANAQAERLPGTLTAKGAFRYVPRLTAGQIDQLESATRQGGSIAADAAAAGLLDSAQMAMLQAAKRNLQMSISQISVAETSVLPMPDLLKHRRVAATRPRFSGTQSIVPTPVR